MYSSHITTFKYVLRLFKEKFPTEKTQEMFSGVHNWPELRIFKTVHNFAIPQKLHIILNETVYNLLPRQNLYTIENM
jgi:hypothetical protein